MSWARYITGWATAEVTGVEPEKLLCALAEKGIAFWDAAPPEDYSLTVRIPERAVRLVPQMARAMGCEAVIRDRHGIPALWRRICHRYVLLACAALVLALLYVGSAFIWEIDIVGNETIPDGPIRQALSECGVDIGAYWPGLSQDQVRNSVILRVPGIRWMTVTIRGSHAKVVVREIREHPAVVRDLEYGNIVAAKAALVEQVEPKRGTALTDRGKAVLPGEVLIGGYATGRFQVTGPVRAVGNVTARTWYEITAKSPLEADVKASAGKKTVRWALILGKTRINFYKGSSICPVGCDKIIESRTVGRAGLFALPITLEKTTYTAYETTREKDAKRQEAMEQLLTEELSSRMEEGGQVLASQFSHSVADGVMYVTLRAECREQIGRYEPLTPQELAQIEEKIPKPNTEDSET